MIYRNRFLAAAAFVLAIGIANAQSNATLTGTIVDTTQAAHPGVSITATENGSGQQYTATSDERGEYRIVNMQPGNYKVEASLSGFAALVVPRVELLVGQTASLPLQLKVANVSQTVEVQGEAELVNNENQQVGGNINRTQMDEIPLLSRNVQDLALLVKGVTANDTSNNSFGASRDDLFQVNLDGQQITQQISIAAAFGEPVLSRDSVAEFQLVTNQYDITQGRSEGEQVNVITRSGTNDIHATVYGNFRRDTFNGSDFVAHTVLPYSQSIVGGTIGGPIIKDKLHYFLSYEYTNQPQTVFVAPVLYAALPAGQNSINIATPSSQYNMLARGDYTINAKNTLTVRGTFWNSHVTQCACQQSYPTSETAVHTYNPNVLGTWTNILSPNIVQEVQVGFTEFFWKTALGPGIAPTPDLNFTTLGMSIGPSFFYPETFNTKTPSIHYNVDIHHGTHELKLGAEALFRRDARLWPEESRGQLFVNAPTGSPFTSRFPLADFNNPAAWNESNLIATVALQDFYPRGPQISMPRHEYGIWAGDTWHPFSNVTITLGLRWDVDLGEYDPPGLTATNALVNNGWGTNANIGVKTSYKDFHDLAPRGGISWSPGKGFVVRAGAGVFYAMHDGQLTLGLTPNQQGGQAQFSNTYVNFAGSPAFLTNYANGATAATYAANPALAGPQSITSIASNFRDPRAVQGTFGLQKQIGSSWEVDSDLVYTKGEFLAWSPDANQNLDPLTGYTFNPNYIAPHGAPKPALRPDPAYAGITLLQSNLHSQYFALASSVTKRFSKHWQAGLTHTVMFQNNDEGAGSGLGFSSISTISNQVCPSCEYGRSSAFQRNTLRLNAIYHGPWGMNVSGAFYYGSGNFFPAGIAAPQNYIDSLAGFLGTNRLNAGQTAIAIPTQYLGQWTAARVIQPGQTLTRDAFHGLPIYKVDMSIFKDFKFHDRIVLTPRVDVFNLFNHPNYGSYNLIANLPKFGAPSQDLADSYVPREFQFAFHITF